MQRYDAGACELQEVALPPPNPRRFTFCVCGGGHAELSLVYLCMLTLLLLPSAIHRPQARLCCTPA
jgi:hypothetical protein